MKSKFKILLPLLMLVVLFNEFGCQAQSKGFALPEGSIEEGRRSFAVLQCTQCHSIADIEWTGIEIEGDVHVRLGGETTTLKTYGELVTSIINPTHRIARKHILQMTTKSMESKMKRYNEIMTVQELVDLVSFLQDQYEFYPHPNRYIY